MSDSEKKPQNSSLHPAQPRLIVVSGPSGVGKGTILKEVFERSGLPLEMSVSATTRPPRPGEIDGVHYHFLSREEFDDKIKTRDFLEHFQVFGSGHWYGTLRERVRESMERGKWVVLEIDVQGARLVRENFPDAITIFIEPKNAGVLKERLCTRGTESEQIILERTDRAMEELKSAGEYHHRIVNDELEDAVQKFLNILSEAAEN